MNSNDEIIPSHMFDRIMERFDKLESRMDTNYRRLGKLLPPSHPKPLYSQPPVRQPSGWDPPPHRAARRYSSYDQPRRPTCWDPPLYRQTPYTDMDSSYAPRQYTTANFGQPPYSSDESPRKPYAGYHRGQHEYQPTQPPYRPPRSPTCWESPEYVPPIPLGCPPPHAAESRRLSRPYLRHDPFSPSLPTVAAVPPPPPQRSSSCLSMTSHCRSAAPLLAVAAVPSSNLAPPAPACSPNDDSGEESRLLDEPPPPAVISPPCSPYISEEEETLLDDDEEVDSIEKVNDSNAKRKEEVNNTFQKLIEKEIRLEALGCSLEAKEKDLSMLPEKQSKIEKMEILSRVEEGKTAFEIQKHDLEGKMEEKRGLFESEISVKTEKLVTKKTAISNTMKILKKRGQSCAFDPGGSLRRVVVSTLRTRWILTMGELLRAFI